MPKSLHSSEAAAVLAPQPEAVKDQLAKILASPLFRTVELQRNFLSYVVIQTIEGRGASLKEFSIGVEALGRGPSFDPRIDTIVRVEARKLRLRLTQYYADEGQFDLVRISLVKGTYVPVFETAGPTTTHRPSGVSRAARAFPFHKSWIVAAALMSAILATLIILWPRFSRQQVTPSIVVLPFTGGDAQSEFLSDGITEDVIDSLGQNRRLRIVARTSAFSLKNSTLDAQEIGRRLDVQMILEGRIRESNSRMNVTVHLIDASTGFRVWSETYDESLDNLSAIQNRIASAVATALGAQTSTDQASASHLKAKIDPEAYKNYMKGRYFWNRSNKAEDLQTAIQFFQRAISADPNYAPSYVGLAGCYVALPGVANVSFQGTIQKIREAANKALELDPNIGEAHLDLAVAHEREYGWRQAEDEFAKGLSLDPRSATGHRRYSTFLVRIGRATDGLREAKEAYTLDPVSAVAATAVGTAYYALRDYDKAIEAFREAIVLDPAFVPAHDGLALAYVPKKMYKESLAELETGEKVMGKSSRLQAYRGYVYAKSGNIAAAQSILAGIFSEFRDDKQQSAGDIALVYIALGENDKAFSFLNQALERGEMPAAKRDVAFDSIRSDPRFEQIFNRIGLAE